MSNTITALFDTRMEAETALAQLDQAGYTPAQVTMLITEESRGKHFGVEDKTKMAEGAATGGRSLPGSRFGRSAARSRA